MLPEIACPVIEGETRKGSIYNVHKVGFLALSAADCKDADLSGVVFERGKYFFQRQKLISSMRSSFADCH
jgi:hypothetical protein